MGDMFNPDALRDRQTGYYRYLKSRIDKAFDWGTVMAVRTQVWAYDKEERFGKDTVPCPRCFDFVRQDARDPHCPICSGNGWTERIVDTGEIVGGYRPLILVKAHVEELSDEKTNKPDGGYIHTQRDSFWLAYADTRLRDGDLIAEIIPDNYTNPQRVRKVLEKYEVVANVSPDFKPIGTVNDNLMAQRVMVSSISKERPEFKVDMGESHAGFDVEQTGSRTNILDFDL